VAAAYQLDTVKQRVGYLSGAPVFLKCRYRQSIFCAGGGPEWGLYCGI